MPSRDFENADNNYTKKMRYRETGEERKIKVKRGDKRRKQIVRNTLNNISMEDILEDNFEDIENLWDED